MDFGALLQRLSSSFPVVHVSPAFAFSLARPWIWSIFKGSGRLDIIVEYYKENMVLIYS
jgi:hypothetical protein